MKSGKQPSGERSLSNNENQIPLRQRKEKSMHLFLLLGEGPDGKKGASLRTAG